MTAEKTPKVDRRKNRRKKKRDDGLVEIRHAGLKLSLKLSAVRQTRFSLETALKGGGSSAQIRFDGRELSEIYVYVGMAQMKKIVQRLAALELGDPAEVSR